MWDHFCWHGLTLIPEWISNYIPYKMCNEMSYSIQLQWFYRSEYPSMFVNTHCCTKRAKYAYPDVQCDILCLHIEAFSNGFSWTNLYEFWLKFHWSLFLGIHITIFQHWFRWWLAQAIIWTTTPSHYLNLWCLVYWRIYASLGLNEFNHRHMFMKFLDKKCFFFCNYRSDQIPSNLWYKRTLRRNELVDHSSVIGASPVGAALTTSSLLT